MNVRTCLAALAVMGMVPLAACTDDAGEEAAAPAKNDGDLALALAGADDLSQFSAALTGAGLAGVFKGPGDYTVLAPDNAAFDKLGDTGKQLQQPDQQAILAAILREHILPGAMTREDIAQALDNAQGKPVTVATMGSGAVQFSKEGDTIIATGADGSRATLSADAIKGTNGVAIPIDGLLKAAGG